VDSKDGTMEDRVLEVEAGEIVTDTDTIGDGEVPVLPESFSVVQDDALAEVVGSVADELDAVAERLAVGRRFFIPVGEK